MGLLRNGKVYQKQGVSSTRLMIADSTQAIRLWRSGLAVDDASNSVYGNLLWSSTEYSANNARNVNNNNNNQNTNNTY